MATCTGDLKNNVLKLLREIRRMKLEVEPDTGGWCVGSPASFLPVLHSALMDYSLPLAQWLASQGCTLYAKSDRRFLEGVYRVLRDAFSYHPKLTREQFLADGYAERKVMLTCDFLLLCQAKHSQLTSGSKKRPNRTSKRTHSHLGHGQKKRCEREGSPPEVLTVHEGPGVGSVWSAGIPVLAESEPKGSRFRADHTLQVHMGTPSHTLPGHPLADHHLPDQTLPTHRNSFAPSTPLSPPTVSPQHGHDVTSHSRIPNPASSQIWNSAAPHTSRPHPSLGEQNLVHSEVGTDVNMTTPPGTGEMEEESWKSLPLASAEEISLESRQHQVQSNPGEGATLGEDGLRENPSAAARTTGGHNVAREAASGRDQVLELSSRVGQLTQLVEDMTARFVLVETQLMLAQSQGGREGVRRLEHKGEGLMSTRSQREREGVGRPEGERVMSTRSQREREGVGRPEREGERVMLAWSQDVKENGGKEGGTASTLRKEEKVMDERQPLATPDSNRMNARSVKASYSSPVCSPLWTPPIRPHPASKPHPSLDRRSSHLGCTPNNWRSPLQGTPSTEETQQLIEKLRSRALKTKLFLQQATSGAL